MTLLRYARSTYTANRTSGDVAPKKRGGHSRSQRRRQPSRSALKRSSMVPSEVRDLEHADTIIDPPRRSRASFAVMAAMLLGGVCGLGVGFLRSGVSEEALLSRSSAGAPSSLEVLPALADAQDAREAQRANAVIKTASVGAVGDKAATKSTIASRGAAANADTTNAALANAGAMSAAVARVPGDDAAGSDAVFADAAAKNAGVAAGAAANAAGVGLADEPAREIITDRLREREPLSLALSRHSVGIEDINALVAALRGKVDLRGLRAGDVFRLESKDVTQDPVTSASALAAFEYRPRHASGAPVRWRVERKGEGWRVEKKVTPVTTKVVALGGEVSSSLYVALRALGEGGALVSRFVDVFAWDIDFYRQPKKGDTFKVIVEKQFADGRFVGYGKVLAAEYVNAGEVHRGFAFSSKDDKLAGYFDENGRAREKTFLKNPLEIALITSSYGQRFHPVLRRQKAHHGVDYGAGKGTAFWAVADGVVQEARYSRTAGNMIVLRHINGYTTEYFHASRFAEGIRPGAKVKQRQVIGYVGNTGRSTGPHLHFGMKRKGGYVDPGKQVFPAANPVPQRYLQEFKEQVGPLLVELEALENV